MTPHIFYALIFSDLASEALQKENMHLVPAIKNSLELIFKRLETPKKDKDRLIKIFASQQRFLSTEDEKSSQNNFFRMKDYFYDAFMVFKIGAIAENDEKAIQSAFFWEISVRKRPTPVKKFNGARPNKNRNRNFQKIAKKIVPTEEKKFKILPNRKNRIAKIRKKILKKIFLLRIQEMNFS